MINNIHNLNLNRMIPQEEYLNIGLVLMVIVNISGENNSKQVF